MPYAYHDPEEQGTLLTNPSNAPVQPSPARARSMELGTTRSTRQTTTTISVTSVDRPMTGEDLMELYNAIADAGGGEDPGMEHVYVTVQHTDSQRDGTGFKATATWTSR